MVSETDLEPYITEYALVYEDYYAFFLPRVAGVWVGDSMGNSDVW